MKTNDKTHAPRSNTQLVSIDVAALGDVTGGCGACGQNCANGPAPATAGGVNRAGLMAAAFSAFSRR